MKQVFEAKSCLLWWTCCRRECNEFLRRRWPWSDSRIWGLPRRAWVTHLLVSL